MQKRNPSVQLALNGTPVYLNNILMSVSVKREEKDMSGQKSSTKKSDKGVKAKELSVTGFIPYNNARKNQKLKHKGKKPQQRKVQKIKVRLEMVVNLNNLKLSKTIRFGARLTEN